MPRGVALSLQYRILIYSRLKAGFSARQIFELVFGAESLFVTLRHLQKLERVLLGDYAIANEYICGPRKKKLVEPA